MNAAGRWPRSWYAAGQGRRRKLEISNTQCAFDEPANVEVVPSKGGVGIFGGPLEQIIIIIITIRPVVGLWRVLRGQGW